MRAAMVSEQLAKIAMYPYQQLHI
eukprot:COSAG05_NODE_21017_length_275_cov_0.585227_2_plen_23_part_01